MATTARSRNGKQKVRVHNPPKGATLLLEGRKTNMAARTANRKSKGGGKSRSRRKNTTQSAAKASPARKLNTGAARTPNRRNTRRGKGGYRRKRNTGLRRFNPFSVGGLQLKNLAAAGGGALAVSLASNLLFGRVQNPWLKVGLQLGLAWAVFKVAPRSVNDAATAGAATVGVVNAVNILVPDLQSRISQWLPINQQTPATGNGVGQLVDVNPALYAGGMGQLAYAPAQSEYIT
jgi:hypothetical protein